jgi:hypothetical protein
MSECGTLVVVGAIVIAGGDRYLDDTNLTFYLEFNVAVLSSHCSCQEDVSIV